MTLLLPLGMIVSSPSVTNVLRATPPVIVARPELPDEQCIEKRVVREGVRSALRIKREIADGGGVHDFELAPSAKLAFTLMSGLGDESPIPPTVKIVVVPTEMLSFASPHELGWPLDTPAVTEGGRGGQGLNVECALAADGPDAAAGR